MAFEHKDPVHSDARGELEQVDGVEDIVYLCICISWRALFREKTRCICGGAHAKMQVVPPR